MRQWTRLTGELVLCVTFCGMACLGLARWAVVLHAEATAALSAPAQASESAGDALVVRLPSNAATVRDTGQAKAARWLLIFAWLPMVPSLWFVQRRLNRLMALSPSSAPVAERPLCSAGATSC